MLICIVPNHVGVGLQKPYIAARWLFAALGLVLTWNLVRRDHDGAVALIVATLPAVMLLRGSFLYNSVALILGLGVGAAVLGSERRLQDLVRAGFPALFFACVLYWLVSFAYTGEYFNNLRILEMLLAAACIPLLAAGNRGALATALWGLAGCLIVLGLALLRYGGRLGVASVQGDAMGNPMTFGVPVALVLLLACADGGRWLLLQRQLGVRFLLTAVMGGLLILSTARGAWLVGAAGLSLILLLGARQRRFAFSAFAGALLVGAILLQSPVGAELRSAVDRTFSTDRSLVNRTSGRSDQWMIFPQVLADVPLWGYGPGTGAEIYAQYSLSDPRVQYNPGGSYQWHSLYQHVVVETGFIGGAILLALIGSMALSNLGLWRRSGDLLPLLGIASFAIIAATVSGMDAASGLFVGVAMTGTPRDAT
jgi:O-antigen ligase